MDVGGVSGRLGSTEGRNRGEGVQLTKRKTTVVMRSRAEVSV